MRARAGVAALAAALGVAVLLGSGSAAPAQDAGVTIYRDAFGIPHVESATERGVAYGTGYALAEDRLFLTAAIRLTAQGRTAELLGRDALRADIAMRRDFYDAADVQRQYDALPQARKDELEAFSAGFNAGMAKVMRDPNRRPAAFDILGYTPEPWKPTDSLSVVALFTWVSFAGEGGGGQLRNAALLGRLTKRFGARRGYRLWNDILFKNDPAAPTVSRRDESGTGPRAFARERPGRRQRRLAIRQAEAIGEAAEVRGREIRAVERVLARMPVPRIGSYAATLSPERTRSGGALVVGAPQSGLNAPSVFWQLGQHGPERDCTGFTVPGLGPWTGIGWCNGHAWSLVAGNMGEQVDNYVERLHPEDDRRYRFRGEWREMTVRRETFVVNKCVPPICSEPSPPSTEVREFDETVHGPVVARNDDARLAITQRRAQRGRWGAGVETISRWNTARDIDAFEAGTDIAASTYNLLYGDEEGNTLYRFTGLQPVRARGYDRRLPAPGTGRAEWRRFLPTRRMPRVKNPRSGVLVANQGVESKPARWWPNASSVGVGQVTRVGWNRRQLGRTDMDVEKMEALNPALLERVDGITPFLAGHLRRALRGSPDPRVQEALALFEEWADAGFARVDEDGDGNYDHPAVMIFGADHFNLPGSQYPRILWSRLIDRVFQDELGAPAGGTGERGSFQLPGGGFQRLSLLKLALDGRRASRPLSRDFVDDLRTRRREKAVDLIRASLEDTIEALEERFGTDDMRRWLGPVPVMRFGALGLVEPPPIRGFDHGTYSHIVDPKAGEGRYILPPGNSSADGAPEIAAAQFGEYPKHFVDQLRLYENYEFLDMPRARDQYTSATESVTRLSVP